MTLLALLACKPAAPAETAEPIDTAVYLTAPSIEPVLGLDELDGAVASAITGGAVFPLTFYNTWVAVVNDIALAGPNDGTDQSCDGGFVDSTTVAGHQTAECFSFDGTNGQDYSIQGGWIADVSLDERRDVTERVANVLYSFRAVRLATGDDLYAGGHLAAGWRLWEDSISFDLMIQGTYLDSGADDASADTIGAGTWWIGTWSPEGFAETTFEGPTGSADEAVDFRGFALDTASGPGPIGTLQLRDPSGGWWVLDFEDDYSGCGTASFDGAAVGDTCAGLSAVAPLNGLFVNAQAAGW